ncbi:MAG: DUF2339 domain-containing protein [Candidatus Latescibacteria bacterium]|jgi:uncharacterized membrane protein|nr:DUF2339 domain-containing protein [Candidatus Latescibacterota bacterium]
MNHHTLDERITRLENLVAAQGRALEQLTSTQTGEVRQTSSPSQSPISKPPSPKPGTVSTPTKQPALSKTARQNQQRDNIPPQIITDATNSLLGSESWTGRTGIGLILFGIVFLFKYSIDQGWITPSVRVGIGLALGAGLLFIAARTHASRRHFSQLLSGGGIAAFYITGFAAFQFYAIVSHPIAFAFMILVTILAFTLSLKQNDAVISIIAAIGGLGTPFFLYTESGNIPGLVAYTCLVLTGTSGIYFYRGWRSLLWVSVIGGWFILFIGINNASQQDHLALQLGIVFAWLAFWALPVFREVLQTKSPVRWSSPSLDFLAEFFSPTIMEFTVRHVHLLSVSTPLIALSASAEVWNLSTHTLGWITMGGAAFYGLTAWKLRSKTACQPLAYTHSLVALLLLTLAFCLLLKGNTLFLTLAAEAAVLHLIARWFSSRGILTSAHILFSITGLILIAHLLSKAQGISITNPLALTDLAVMAIGLSITQIFRSQTTISVYRMGVHLTLLAWFWRELSPLHSGMGYVTIVWGTYAVALLVFALRHNLNQLQAVALGTLFLVVGKLFMIDLAQLAAHWRILLFLGFGGLFLIISYYFQSLKNRTKNDK